MTIPYQLHNKANQSQKQLSSSSFDFKLLQKPFWIWDKKEHLALASETNGECCWNHIVGLPQKDRKEYPLFDYEKILFNSLLFPHVNNPLNHDFKDKHLWIKKATGHNGVLFKNNGLAMHIYGPRVQPQQRPDVHSYRPQHRPSNETT